MIDRERRCLDCYHYEACQKAYEHPTDNMYDYDCAHFTDWHNVIVMPCKDGDTVYRIRRMCDCNKTNLEKYAATKQFDYPCELYEKNDDGELCRGTLNRAYPIQFCTITAIIYCDECVDRFTVEPCTYSSEDYKRVANTPSFNRNIPLYDMLFLTKEEAEKKIKEVIDVWEEKQMKKGW